MPLTHVCVWDKNGWKKITVNQAVKMTYGGVSARSGLFMCELCGQYVSLTAGHIRDPYFKHSKEEESKDCPERSVGVSISEYYNSLKLESKGLPIRVNITNNCFEILVGFPKIPTELLEKLDGAYINIKDDIGKTYKYSINRIENNTVTYLKVGDYPSSYYQIMINKDVDGIETFWPKKIIGFRERTVLDSKGNVLPYDSDVKVKKEYYTFGKNYFGFNYNSNHVEVERMFVYRYQNIYKIKALDFSEESARFFLELHCRLTENPIDFIPLWPVTIQAPYIIYHNKEKIYGVINGNANFATFPKSYILRQEIKKHNLIKIQCNDRQQLLSIGRASNILNYTYLWKDNLVFEDDEKTKIKVLDGKNNIITQENVTDVKPKSIYFISKYDGKFVIENEGFIEEIRYFKANMRFTYNGLRKNRKYKIFQSNDCAFELDLHTKIKSNEINEREVIKTLNGCRGRLVPLRHSFGNIARYFEDYPLIKIWIRKQIIKGHIKEDALNILKKIIFNGGIKNE